MDTKRIDEMTLLEAALYYARVGYRIFPCKPRSKKPATEHGFKDATANEEQIRAWWQENPEYNIGIPTGAVNGFFALDLDSDKVLGDAYELGFLHNPTVKTGRGHHVWYAYPGRKVSNSPLKAGMDVRGDGGYVIAPPSLHESGATYQMIEEGSLLTNASENLLRHVCPEWGKANEVIGTLAKDVKPEKVDWLWKDKIPLGKITILDGDPGLGKSLITTDIAARVSTGRHFPDGREFELGCGAAELRSCGVVMLSAEDGMADTIRPRLDIAGADTGKVLILSNADGERSLCLPEDISTIKKAIDRVDAKLVVIDPLMAFLSPNINANSDQQVRQALTPLKELAERKDVAVILVRHLNKGEAKKALYRGGSSIGIIGACRVGMVVEEHPDQEDIVVLATTKNNLAPKGKSLTYSVSSKHHEEIDDNVPYVEWGGTTDLNANDLFNVDSKKSKEEQAAAWLKQILRDGPKLQEDIKAQVEEHGQFSYRTVEAAKSSLGIFSKKRGDKWEWHLPDQDRKAATPQGHNEPLDGWTDGLN